MRWAILFPLILNNFIGRTQLASGDYRSIADGFWQDTYTWEVYDGTNWVPAIQFPTDSDGNIEIRNGHTITLSANLRVDQVVIKGKLVIEPNVQISAGAASSMIEVYNGGIFANQGIVGGDYQSNYFYPGSRYQHLFTTLEGTIPLARWDTASILEIIGYTTALNATPLGNWSQNFGHVEWNCPGQMNDFFLNGLLKFITGDFRIINTNAYVLRFTYDADMTFSIGGSFNVTGTSRFSVSKTGINNNNVICTIGNDFNFFSSDINGSRICEQGISTFQVGGNFNMDRGIVYFSSGTGGTSSSGADLKVSGDFNFNGGTIDASIAKSNRVGDLYFTGITEQKFFNGGAIIGYFNYHLRAGSIVRIVGENAVVGNNFECGDGSGGATLIAESSHPSGAIQKGQTGGGNIKVRTQTFREGSAVVYAGSQTQYISSDHPSTSGVHCYIDNSNGVWVSSYGNTVIIGGNLIVFKGNVLATFNNLTVRKNIETVGGSVIIDTTPLTAQTTLVVDGDIVMSGGNIQLKSNSASNAANAQLVINGDLRGTNFFTFNGANCQVSIGGVSRSFSRDFPIDIPTTLELLTMNVAGGNTMLTIPNNLVLGNYTSSTGTYSGGLNITSGSIRMNATLKVTSVINLTGGTLFFEGQTIELQRNINTNYPTGVFSSNENSTMKITSGFAGVDNTIAFASSGNTIGTLLLDRSANFTVIGGFPVTPHVRLNSPLIIAHQLFLKDGEFYNESGLQMAKEAFILRTPDAAFSQTTIQNPLGGPYNIIYSNGNASDLTSGIETTGNLFDLSVNITGSLHINTPVVIGRALYLNNGEVHNNNNLLSLARGALIRRHSDNSFSGMAPEGGPYRIIYVGQSLITQAEVSGALSSVTINCSGVVQVNLKTIIPDTVRLNSGGLSNALDSLHLLPESIFVRNSGTQVLGIVPKGGPYDVCYLGRSLSSQVESMGNVDDLSSYLSDSLLLNNNLGSLDTLAVYTGVFISGAYSIVANTVLNNGVFVAPGRSQNFSLNGDMVNNGFLDHNHGVIAFNGNSWIRGISNPKFYTIEINGILNSPPVLYLSGHFINNSSFFHQNGQVEFSGDSIQNIEGKSVTDFNHLLISNQSGVVQLHSPQNLFGLVTVRDGSVLDVGESLLTLKSISSSQAGSIGKLDTKAEIKGQINVERFMAKEGPYNRYISSPVSEAWLSDLSDDFKMIRDCAQTYDETVTGIKEKGYYVLGMNSRFDSGKGYLVFPASPFDYSTITWDISGPLIPGSNRGAVDLNVTYTTSTPPSIVDDGWNLVGNPYPSAIQWTLDPRQWSDKFGNSDTRVGPVIFVPDVAHHVFRSWDASTGIGDLGEGSGIIALGQAFWVHAIQSGASLVVHEEAKTESDGKFYRKEGISYPYLKISLSKGEVNDNSFLVMRPDCTPLYDQGKDALKFPGGELSVSILSPEGLGMAHYATGDVSEEIPLYVSISSPGTYGLAFIPMNNFTLDDLYLVDYQVNRYYDLSANTTFKFLFSGNPVVDQKRFSLVRGHPELREKEPTVIIFPNPVTKGLLTIQVMTNERVDAEIYDQTGRVLGNFLLEKNENGSGIITDVGHLQPGLYLVKLTLNEKNIIRKIIIR